MDAPVRISSIISITHTMWLTTVSYRKHSKTRRVPSTTTCRDYIPKSSALTSENRRLSRNTCNISCPRIGLLSNSIFAAHHDILMHRAGNGMGCVPQRPHRRNGVHMGPSLYQFFIPTTRTLSVLPCLSQHPTYHSHPLKSSMIETPTCTVSFETHRNSRTATFISPSTSSPDSKLSILLT